MRHIDTIVIHCSATPPSMDVGVEEIEEWHINRGWSEVGYHFVIRRDGTIEDGRDLDKVGAHAKGFNANSIGICYVGGVDSELEPEDNKTQAQSDSLFDLVGALQVVFGRCNVLGHCDLPRVTKACPSFNVKEWYEREKSKRNATR